MFHSSHITIRRYFRRACCACMIATMPLSLHAAVVNKYTFNQGNANDSVGGMNGTLVDNTGIANFTGGNVNLSGNNGAGSAQDFTIPTTVGAFVDLPDGVFTGAVNNNGVFGQASLEIWFTVQQNHTWAEVYTFGTSDGGEDVSGGGDNSDYVALIPSSGPGDFRGTTKVVGAGMETPLIGSPTPLTTNQKHHVVMTFDMFDSTAGPNGTAKLYLNNGVPVSAEIRPFIDLMTDNNNWLGRSQWGDPLFDGLIDEFRIYDTTLSAAEVASSFAVGPDPAPLPVLVVNRDTGEVSIKNESGGGIQLKGYSISSVAGSLVPASWTSIDAVNTFDPNGTWTAQSLTDLNIAESVTGGTLDGGTLAGNTPRTIGTPWEATPFEDLVFSFTLGDDSTGFGLVQYTETAVSRSDLNGDGSINTLDWGLFVPNSFTTFAGDTGVEAYFKGDLDGDLDNDYQDFKLFKTDFIAANGLSAFNALTGAVPEPNTLVLMAFASTLLAGLRRQ